MLPRSPDLTSMDFLFWVLVKSICNVTTTNLELETAFELLMKTLILLLNLCKTVCLSIPDHLQKHIKKENDLRNKVISSFHKIIVQNLYFVPFCPISFRSDFWPIMYIYLHVYTVYILYYIQ